MKTHRNSDDPGGGCGAEVRLSDADLVRRAASGDGTAFDGLVRRYRGLVLGIARAMTSDWDRAEDVAQQALIEAHAGLRGLREPEKFRSWLGTIARRCATRSRAQERGGPPMLALSENVVGILEAWHPQGSSADLSERVKESLRELSARSRQVMTLHYLDGYTCREIGDRLGLPAGTVKRVLHEGRADLRTMFRSAAGREEGRGAGDLMQAQGRHEVAHGGPRGMRWWVMGSWPGQPVGDMLRQSICLTVNKQPKGVDEIAREVDAHAGYVQDALRPLLAEGLVIETAAGRYRTGFIAMDAADWIELTRGARQDGVRLADSLLARLPELERAWNATSQPAKGFAWLTGIWPTLALFVLAAGVSRVMPPEPAAPLRPSGHQYWAGGHEVVGPEHLVWTTGFNMSTSGQGRLSYGWFWSDGVDRAAPETNNEMRGRVLAILAEGAVDAESVAGRAGLPAERARESLANAIRMGLAARVGGRLTLTFPVMGVGDSDVLTPAVDSVAAQACAGILLPATADVDDRLRAAGYGHLEEQFPLWQTWARHRVAGEGLRELLRRGILPDPGHPAPATFCLVGWLERPPLLSMRWRG